MNTAKLSQSMAHLDSDQKLVLVASATLADRLARLSPDDAKDAFAVMREWVKARASRDVETVAAAESAFMEILDPAVAVAVRKMELAEHADLSTRRPHQQWLDALSDRLRKAREQAGLTQQQLQDKSGLPQSHISRIENARLSPSRTTLERLAKALRVPLRSLDPSED